MKVTFKYAVGSYSGTIDDMVFYPTKNKLGSFARKWVTPKPTAQTAALGAAATNLAIIYSAVANTFKANLITYRNAYNIKFNDPNDPFHTDVYEYALFVKMMYAFKEDSGVSVDLATLTHNDVASLFTTMDSVKAAVEAGYLPTVPGYELLTGAWGVQSMETTLPDEVIEMIIEQINAAIDLPFLNEKQERMLFSFVLSVVIGAFLKKQKTPVQPSAQLSYAPSSVASEDGFFLSVLFSVVSFKGFAQCHTQESG